MIRLLVLVVSCGFSHSLDIFRAGSNAAPNGQGNARVAWLNQKYHGADYNKPTDTSNCGIIAHEFDCQLAKISSLYTRDFSDAVKMPFDKCFQKCEAEPWEQGCDATPAAGCEFGVHERCGECCHSENDRFAASVINSQTNAGLFYDKLAHSAQVGMVVDNDLLKNTNEEDYRYQDGKTAFLCGYPRDAWSNARHCNPQRNDFNSSECRPGCSPVSWVREGIPRVDQVPFVNIKPIWWQEGRDYDYYGGQTYKPSDFGNMLKEYHRQNPKGGRTKYNEVIIDGLVFKKNLPYSLAAFYFVSGTSNEDIANLCAQQKTFLKKYNVTEDQFPIVKVTLYDDPPPGGYDPFQLAQDYCRTASRAAHLSSNSFNSILR